MPRKARLDAPGTLHHVIIRGIERRNIVDDDIDRDGFVSRLGKSAEDTSTQVYAWALMTNHAHFLLRSGACGLPTFMRRLLSGHAIYYNRRHNRYGHLFQNRYKSIVCEEDAYFTELVRYIHLNPLRAGLVESMEKLDRYKWCGHSAILGNLKNPWQDRDFLLEWFGKNEREARRSYRAFVKKGIQLGKRPELTGGGFVRSMGGWSVVKAMRAMGDKEDSDERILGNGEFVTKVIEEAEGKVVHQFQKKNLKKIIQSEIDNFCRMENVDIYLLKTGSRIQPLPKVRRKIVLKLVNDYGVPLAEIARNIGISTSGVAQIVKRNRK